MKTLRRFEEYHVHLDHFSMKNGTDEIFMEPRLMKLLEVLVRNSNDVVKKEEILASAWADVVVNDESIPRAISDLRKALGEHFSGILLKYKRSGKWGTGLSFIRSHLQAG